MRNNTNRLYLLLLFFAFNVTAMEDAKSVESATDAWLRSLAQPVEVGLYPGQAPIDNINVVVTFPKPEARGTYLGLGHHAQAQNPVQAVLIPCFDMDQESHNYLKDGFQLINLPEDLKQKMEKIRARAINFMENPDRESWDNQWLAESQEYIDMLEEYAQNLYSKLFKKDVIVKASRRMLIRTAGLNSEAQGSLVPGNPLFHTDYLNLQRGYEVQSQFRHGFAPEIPLLPQEQMIDMFNFWIPLGPVLDWPLGFISSRHYEQDDLFEIAESRAATLEYKNGMSVSTKKSPPMDWGEAYMFRTAGIQEKDGKRIPGVVHGAFRFNKEQHLRKSMELRLMVFSK